MNPRSEPEPAARVFRDRSGSIQVWNCLLVYSSVAKLDHAIEKAQAGKTVFVAREDVPAILSALGAQP